jgi:hypothetical protein
MRSLINFICLYEFFIKFKFIFINFKKLIRMAKSAHKNQSCELFGTFGFFVQFTLGVISFMVLISILIIIFQN